MQFKLVQKVKDIQIAYGFYFDTNFSHTEKERITMEICNIHTHTQIQIHANLLCIWFDVLKEIK